MYLERTHYGSMVGSARSKDMETEEYIPY
jgi:hypothetical protein